MGEFRGVVLVSAPHKSVYPRFCPDLSRAEPPRVKKRGLPGAQRVGLGGPVQGSDQSGSWDSGGEGPWH